MKRYHYLILAVLSSALLFSCKEPDPVKEPEVVISLKVEPTLLSFANEGGSKTFAVKTNADAWEISVANASWLQIDPKTGNGDATITVTAGKNEGARRTAVISLKAKDAKTVEVAVSQDKGEAPVEKTGLYADPEKPDVDQPCVLYYKADRHSPFFDKSGDIYAHIGINEWANVQADWGQNTDKCKFQKTDTPNLWKL